MSKWICGNCGDPCLFNSKDGTDYPTACPLGVVNVKWEPADEFASDYICDFCPAESDNCGKYCKTGKCKEAWLTWLKVDTAETQAIAATVAKLKAEME